MKKVLAILAVLCIMLVGCQQATVESEKVSVVTTIFPLYEFAKEVGGDKVDVTLLLPPGAEPHSFEPTAEDIKITENADVFLYVGESMEPWAHDILEGVNNKNLIIVEATEFVELISSDHVHSHDEEHEHEADEDHHEETEEEHEHEAMENDHDHEHTGIDPHVWLSFENDVLIVNKIAEVLSSIDSENAEYYVASANDYSSKLITLDETYSASLSLCNKEEFIVGGHNFFGYIEHEYNVEGIAAIENLEPNTEPTPKALKELSDLAEEHEISYVLSEVLVSQRMAEAIAEETGAEVLVFNPAANLAKEEFKNNASFISIMEDNLETLKTALECN